MYFYNYLLESLGMIHVSHGMRKGVFGVIRKVKVINHHKLYQICIPLKRKEKMIEKIKSGDRLLV